MKPVNNLALLSLLVLGACSGNQQQTAAKVQPAPPSTTIPAPASAPQAVPDSAPQPPSAHAAAPATLPTDPASESMSIPFSNGSATLSPSALSQLDGAARLYRSAHPEVMLVTGHSDTVGEEYPNLILSAQRALAVKRALVDRGVPSNQLQMVADGEAQPVPGVMPNKVAVLTWR